MTSSNAIRLLSAISLTALLSPLQAQEHFEVLCDTTPWLMSRNVAGLCALPEGVRTNYAEAYFEGQKGGWCDYSQSSDSYQFGAGTASYFRVNEQLALSGSVSYDNFTGRDMTGSVWLHPEDQPFDIVEMNPASAGTKNRETYQLTGALGYDFGPLQLGAGVDFTAANNAKRRDLRIQNKLTDLQATIGLTTSRPHDLITLGLSYTYRRTLEELLFKTYGTTETLYASLIDYGASFGVSEYSNAGRLTDENEERPLVTQRHTVSLQASLQLGQAQWFNEGSLEWRSGYYGKHSLYTPVFMEHQVHSWQYRGVLTWLGHHSLQYEVGGSHLRNFQNVYSYVNQGGGLNEYIYYGQLLTRSQRSLDAGLTYKYYRGSWLYRSSLAYHELRLTASNYPCYRQQTLRYYALALSALRQWHRGPHDWSVQLALVHQRGSGTMAHDGEYTSSTVVYESSTSDASPSVSTAVSSSSAASSSISSSLSSGTVATLPAALQQHYDYLTAPQGSLVLSLLYGRQLSHHPLRPFVRLDAHYHRAWSVTADVETHCQGLSLTAGCTF